MAESGKTERGKAFWDPVTVKMKFTVEKEWLECVRKSDDLPDISMNNRLDEETEDIGYKLAVVGPLVDFYLKHIGTAIRDRLRKSRRTGLMNDFTIPWDLMKYICVLWRNYGGSITTDQRTKRMVLKAVQYDTVQKVFSPSRFCGENYLKRRHYSKIRQPNSRTLHILDGRSAVVVSEEAPFLIKFKMDTGSAKISFYRQNYDKDGICQDLTLQTIINK